MKCVPNITYDVVNDLALDLYLPDNLKASACVIYAHGGGFVKGERTNVEAGHFAKHLTDSGFAMASISYRLRQRPTIFNEDEMKFIDSYVARGQKIGLTLSPKLFGHRFIAGMYDMSKAIEFLWVEGKGLGIKHRKVGVLGVSAGGIAGLGLAYPPKHWMRRVSRPDAVVAICSAMVQPWRLEEGGPPCLMLHGPRDRIIGIENPRLAAMRAEQVGAPVVLIDTGVPGHSTQVDLALDGVAATGEPYMQLILDQFVRLTDD